MIKALSESDIEAGLLALPGWVREGDKLYREFEIGRAHV